MPFEKGHTPEGAKPFEPGESGNPSGRPIGVKNRSTIARAILKMAAKYPDKIFEKLKERYPALEKEMTIEEMMTIVQADKAIRNRDTYAYSAIMDSSYGKATQGVDVTSGGKDFLTNKSDDELKSLLQQALSKLGE